METLPDTQQAADLIYRDFELAPPDAPLSEAELFDLLANHVAWLIEHRLEWLLSLLYRMDIAEHNVQAALLPNAPDPANIGIARLILDRQRQRIHTKKTYRPADLGDEWAW